MLDEPSGLRDAGLILATFWTSDRALLDVLSGRFAPVGRMPFALAGTRRAIQEQHSDAPVTPRPPTANSSGSATG